jgi:hypothetical protein
MARTTKSRQAGRKTNSPWTFPRVAALSLAAIAVASLVLWRASPQEEDAFRGVPAADPGPIHVHGLGINPADGSLFIATHTGLWNAKPAARKATRVGRRLQDTMGFTVVGPDRFLGSGHPDLNEAREKRLPPLLGLIESTDAGKTWSPVSLLGEADFHVLRSAGNRVYGYDASHDRLLASFDRGRTWDELDKPGTIVDLAADPRNAKRIVVAAVGPVEQGLYESRDGGKSWTRVASATGLIAWPASGRLYVVLASGQVFSSPNAGRRLDYRGDIGGEPAALFAQTGTELFVALHDGAIKRSTDGGARWTVYSTP